MSTYAGFRCWDTKQLNETVKKDAVAPKSSVFLATHHPATIRREPLRGGGQPVVTTERELLDAFSVADNPELMLFPITGDSGTGKSHLVRWLHAQLEHQPGWKVVYVPKYGTNLRSIVELILDDMVGDEFVEARRALARAQDEGVDEDLAPERLLDALALQVSRAAIDGEFPDHREYLKEHLPVLLRDPVFRNKLLEENGVLRRLVTLALRGRQVDDQLDDDAGQFSAGDLPLQVTNVTAASEVAKEAFRYLIADEDLQRTAVDLLNESLESAESTLFVSAELRVRDVMLDVRRALLDRGLELVLFIEDLTVLHGVQQELLDALVEPAERNGEAVMCKLRAAIAVTRGYFDGLETVRTRCDHAYDLDVPYDESEAVSVDDAITFVGRYLNAARLGERELDAAHANALARGSAAQVESWVPNACESCPHQVPCHDGFGVSGENEHGLYPFNRPALDRMIRAWSPSHFDPRRVVTEVIHHTMRLAEQELPEGRFPSDVLVKNFNDGDQRQLSADLAADISQADPVDADRRRRVLTFWGGAPNELGDLHPALHEAFELAPLGGIQLPPPPPPGPGPGPGPGSGPVGQPQQIAGALRELDRWHTGEHKLTQGTARTLRSLVHQAVVERLSNGAWDLRVSTSQFGANSSHFRQSSIDLENAAGSGSQLGSAMQLQIQATPENARLLMSAVQASHYGNWEFERGPQRLLEWATQLDQWANHVAESYKTGNRAEQETDQALTALLYGARTQGFVPRNPRDDQLLTAVLSLAEPGAELRSRDWQRLAEAAGHKDRAALRESVLERLGAAKGDGGARAIDASRAVRVLRVTTREWTTETLSVDSPADRYVQRIKTHLDRACDAERGQLQAWYDEVAEHLDPSVPPTQVAPAFLDAVAAAAKAGVLRSPDGDEHALEAARMLAGQFANASLEPIREIREVLERCTDAPTIDQVAELAPDRTTSVTPVLDFCRRADRILADSQTTVDAIAKDGPTATVTVADLDGRLDVWLATLDEAKDATC